MTSVTPPASPNVAAPVNTIGSYGKAIMATVYNTALAILIAYSDKGINGLEWVTIIGTFVISLLGVWGVKNTRSPYLKAITAAVTAAIGALTTALFDGNLTTQELIEAVIAVAGSLGLTSAVSNAAYSDRHLQKR